jgi:hypothetical protein
VPESELVILSNADIKRGASDKLEEAGERIIVKPDVAGGHEPELLAARANDRARRAGHAVEPSE